MLLVSALFILVSVTAVIAEGDGNIDIRITRLDSGFSAVTLLVITSIILLAIILSLVVLLRRRPSAIKTPRPKDSIHVDTLPEPGFRKEGYYDAVFEKPIQAAPVPETEAVDSLDRYLKEDERVIINILRMKHNSCSQATLRVITDFSKARLSRLLAELEERGIIFKQQSGRKNIITLKA